MHPLRSHLEAVGAALLDPKMHNRARGGWDNQEAGPTVLLAPPASAADIAQAERTLGQPLPRTLRQVLSEVSSDVELKWNVPARKIKTTWGHEIEPLVIPPDRFVYWSHAPNADGTPSPNAKRKSKHISGGLRFGLDRVLRAAAGFPFAGTFDNMREGIPDPETLEHYDLIEAFMGYGLPVMTAPNGDWLAIDLRDDRERLLHVSHEGEEAGIELDLTLPQFLTHLSWLGPVWSDFSEIFEFSTETKELIPGDYRINTARFDAEGEHGTAWRAWFWQDTPPPRPDESLLKRV